MENSVVHVKRKAFSLSSLMRNKNIGIVILTFLLLLIFSAAKREFLSIDNIVILLQNMPELGLVAIGMTMLVIAGEFDLSVGSVFALSPFIMVALHKRYGVPLGIGFAAALCAGGIAGCVNGLIVTRIGLPSFIATLGTMEIWRGVLLLLSDGFPESCPSGLAVVNLFAGTIHGFPLSFLWFLLCAAVFWIALDAFRFGNWTYATGGNIKAAVAMGIPVNRVKIVNFIIVGVLAALAGCIQVFRVHSAYPIMGQGLEMNAIAATVIGGTLLTGGRGTIVGTVMGVVILFSVENILILMRAPSFWFRLFVGIVIVLSVAAHIWSGKKRQ